MITYILNNPIRRHFETGHKPDVPEIWRLRMFLKWSSGSAWDPRSLPSLFESRRRHISRLFHLWLRFITFGGHSAHLAYRVHKRGRKTSIIIIIIPWQITCGYAVLQCPGTAEDLPVNVRQQLHRQLKWRNGNVWYLFIVLSARWNSSELLNTS